MEVLDELSLVVWFFLRISEQRAALTSDSMFFWREEMLGAVVVGMKLVPSLSKEMASGGIGASCLEKVEEESVGIVDFV